MIDWNDNAKAAVREFAGYIGESDKCERYLETFETKKTVADAVEVYPKWQEPHFMPTRENLEKIAKDARGDFVEVEQESEKWTHKYVKDNCYIKASEPDLEGYIVVLTETDGYMVCKPEDLMPIKTTISESELLHKIKDMGKGIASNGHFGETVRGWLDKYDII